MRKTCSDRYMEVIISIVLYVNIEGPLYYLILGYCFTWYLKFKFNFKIL